MTVSLNTGYDTGYLTNAVGSGADYYLGAKGEPPGYWQGAGARALGLAGPIGGGDERGGDAPPVSRGHRPGRPGLGAQAAESELSGCGPELAVRADRRGG